MLGTVRNSIAIFSHYSIHPSTPWDSKGKNKTKQKPEKNPCPERQAEQNDSR